MWNNGAFKTKLPKNGLTQFHTHRRCLFEHNRRWHDVFTRADRLLEQKDKCTDWRNMRIMHYDFPINSKSSETMQFIMKSVITEPQGSTPQIPVYYWPLLGQFSPVHILTTHFLQIYFSIIFPSLLGLSSCRFIKLSLPKFHMHFHFTIQATFTAIVTTLILPL
jgi:hypothetical protein